jgi:NAD+ synthase
MFDAVKVKNDCVQWIRDYFKNNPDGKAIIGISGGKDSTICAALLVEALGADRVIGVLMPNGIQSDINDSYRVCNHLGIALEPCNIEAAYVGILAACGLGHNDLPVPPMVATNLPSRLRMCVLYTIAALYPNSRVVNTSNWSERYIGYCTKGGDTVADFSPLGMLTVREVLAIGDVLGLPYDLVHKTPTDGMSGKSDEEKIGFTYDELDDYILYVEDGLSDETVAKIEKMHKANEHKLLPMPMFDPAQGE